MICQNACFDPHKLAFASRFSFSLTLCVCVCVSHTESKQQAPRFRPQRVRDEERQCESTGQRQVGRERERGERERGNLNFTHLPRSSWLSVCMFTSFPVSLSVCQSVRDHTNGFATWRDGNVLSDQGHTQVQFKEPYR